MSEVLNLVQAYFAAWNRGDGEGVAALFGAGGDYLDPTLRRPIAGPELAAYVGQLVAMLPDLRFEVIALAETGSGSVVAEWVMHGTNSAPLGMLPPTGQSVALPGVDLLRVEGGKLATVRGYFDQKALNEQLGLQVIIQPKKIGPVQFGTAIRVDSGNNARPGAFALTTLRFAEEGQADAVQGYGMRICEEIGAMPGFLGLTTHYFGSLASTATAWTDVESAVAMARTGSHKEAMVVSYKKEGIGQAFTTMVLTPHHGRPMVRCEACGLLRDPEATEGTCNCGATLPPAPTWW